MLAPETEWLETDGLGGYAMGTASGIRTRRYHALLCTAAAPPTDRRVLVNGFEVELKTPTGRYALSSNCYAPDVIQPDGAQWINDFGIDPWPTWSFQFADGTRITQEIFMTRDRPRTVVRWRLGGPTDGASLTVRPFVSNRDHHGLHHENSAFHFAVVDQDAWQVLRPYAGAPAIAWLANARFSPEPLWYHHILYREEQARGLDATEDLATPGTLTFDLSEGHAALILSTVVDASASDAVTHARKLAEGELKRRRSFHSLTAQAADSYLVKRGNDRTLIAGYPWFTDWGRDTFISLRGLCLAQQRYDEALGILRAWAQTVDRGMVPNRFPDGGEPEFNAVDASLWFVVVVGELLAALETIGKPLSKTDATLLNEAVTAILEGYRAGTRHGIHVDTDGLVAAGEPGIQLTWMDAKVEDWVVTPRIGKPVEVQALWVNALSVGARHDPAWRTLERKARESFVARFPLSNGQLNDVVDVDHRPGEDDPSMRPNQILAIGGLPEPLLSGERARRVVQAVETELLTPLGLRTLARADGRYRGTYAGDVRTRDGAYHQGSVWPWLMGPFIEASLRVHGRAHATALITDFLSTLRRRASLTGHLPEIADGDAPHLTRGCPFQAWSLAELLRIEELLRPVPIAPEPLAVAHQRADPISRS